MQADVPTTTVPTDDETVLDRLPPDVAREIRAREPELWNELRTGERDEIPEDLIESLPDNVADRIPESLIAGATDNPGLAAVLIIVGVLCVLGAAWGAVKGFLKMALLLAVVGAVAWIWYLN